MKKNISLIATILLLLTVITACSTEQPGNDNEKESSKSDGKVKVGFSVSTLNNPYFVNLRDGAEEAAEEAGIEIVVTDAQDDVSKQVNDIEDLLQQDIDVLLVNPADDVGVASGIESANDAGIPVITVDRKSQGGDVMVHIESDNVVGGEMAGKYILEQLNGEGNVVELQGIPGVLGTRLRGEGFHNIVDGEENINVVASQNADYDRAKGLIVMENILQGSTDVDAVFAHNDEMALGAMEALVAQDKQDVIVVGFDATDDAKESIESGEMSATIEQQPKLMSQYAIETAEKIANGEDVDELIPVELKLYTK